MGRFYVFQLLFIFLAALQPVLQPGLQQGGPAITAPMQGQTLQGSVEITGSLDPVNFLEAELSFAYASDATGTWFLIQTFAAPVEGGLLATWDTANLTDGDYRLRLRQTYLDGTLQEVTVENLHLRNDAPSPTATTVLPASTATGEPSPSPAAQDSPVPSLAAPVTPALRRPTPQPLPPNPASITSEVVYSVFGRAALLVLLLFIMVGGFLGLRRR